jgi:hypothetical protein
MTAREELENDINRVEGILPTYESRGLATILLLARKHVALARKAIELGADDGALRAHMTMLRKFTPPGLQP